MHIQLFQFPSEHWKLEESNLFISDLTYVFTEKGLHIKMSAIIRRFLCKKKSGEDENSMHFKLFKKCYTIEEKALGSGAFGTVYKVHNNIDGGQFALKFLEIERLNTGDDAKAKERAAREISSLRSLDHPNILRYYFAWEIDKLPTKWDGKPLGFPSTVPLYCIQTELCETNLDKKLTECRNGNGNANQIKQIKKFVLQIAAAVRYFHKCGIMHRDLKPDNILIKTDPFGEENIKIGDFGVSRFYTDGQKDLTKSVLGARFYQCMEQKGKKEYDWRCDVYSMGIIFYEMFLHFHHPPTNNGDGNDENFIWKLLQKLPNAHQSPEDFETIRIPTISEGMMSLIGRMLQEQINRPTSEQVFQELSTNPGWVEGCCQIQGNY